MSSHSKSHGKLIKSSLHMRDFPFKVGDLVLVKWSDGMVYFAKIKRIDHKRRKCTVVFDDKSQDEAHFSQIHSGKRFSGWSLTYHRLFELHVQSLNTSI